MNKIAKEECSELWKKKSFLVFFAVKVFYPKFLGLEMTSL